MPAERPDPLAERTAAPGLLADPRRFLLLALLVFPLHVAEEGDRFVPWFNALASPPIAMDLFIAVNAAAFAITAALVAVAAMDRSSGALIAAIGWLAFLFLGNAIFHIVGTIAHRLYSPGALTALFLYLPFYLRLVELARHAGLPAALLAAVTATGAAPMLVHGWLVVFEGGRLF